MFEFIQVADEAMMRDCQRTLSDAMDDPGAIEGLDLVFDFFLLDLIEPKLPPDLLEDFKRKKDGDYPVFSIDTYPNYETSGSKYLSRSSKGHWDCTTVATLGICPPPAQRIANTLIFTGDDAMKLREKPIRSVLQFTTDADGILGYELTPDFAALDIQMHQAPIGYLAVIESGTIHMKPMFTSDSIPRATMLLDDHKARMRSYKKQQK